MNKAYWSRKLIREQLDQKLNPLQDFRRSGQPVQGWIKAMREALGMSAFQLGRKAKLHQSRISRLENAEKSGDLKLSSLRKIAEAMNMRLVYAFVPDESLEVMVRNQARRVAMRRMRILNNTMQLENQEIPGKEQRKVLEDMIEKVLFDPPTDFWGEEA